MNYVQIDEEGYCFAKSTLSGEVDQPNLIYIGDQNIQLGQKYDVGNKVWTNEFRSKEPQKQIVTDTELLQQQLTDIELQNLEAQAERQLLAQQMSDLELAILGGSK